MNPLCAYFARPSTSPSRSVPRSNAYSSASDSQVPRRNFPSAHDDAVEAAPTRTTNYSAAKRTRSPPLPATNTVLLGNSDSSQDDAER